MTIDRTKQPPLNIIEKPEFLKPVTNHTGSGNPYFSLCSNNLPVLKLDIMFPAGSIFDPNPAVGVATANLLTTGTKLLSAAQIAEIIDFHGASVSLSVSKKYVIITVSFLPKQAVKIFDLLSQILDEPTFPQTEIDLFVNKSIRQLQINMEKVSYLASRQFNKMLFSENHAFGKSVSIDDYKKLKSKQLYDFFIRHYKQQKPIILITGDIDKTITKPLEDFIDKLGTTKSVSEAVPTLDIPAMPVSKECLQKEGVQSAIRFGKLTINKFHPDYFKLIFTNTLFGGYFGSRLIKNIREEKGYTYGIYAHLSSFMETGYFYVSADVGSNYGKATIQEVEKEIKLLQDHLVPSDEMERVKNYLSGILLQKFDGVFAISDAFLELKKFDLDWNYYVILSDTIKYITPDEVNNMAKQYFNINEMSSLIVGQC